MLEQVFDAINSFDIIHFHLDYLHFSLSRRYGNSHVTTLHGRLDLPDLVALYREFREMPVVSISNAQREPLPWLNWQATVHHGVPKELYPLREAPGQYLAFLGRISIEKRVDHAVEIARRTGMRLKIAAKIDPADRAYYESCVKPLIDNSVVEFIGEVGDREKQQFLGDAYALVFPIDWPEPFGLVMIEALACGTPILAYRRGSVPEILEDGVTGFVVENLEQAVEAVGKIGSLSRKTCRRVFEERFTVERMARDYLAIYRRLVRHLESPTKEEVLQVERESTTVLDGL
jgi:glycosyltransferase involved in cell wall biosynthesis